MNSSFSISTSSLKSRFAFRLTLPVSSSTQQAVHLTLFNFTTVQMNETKPTRSSPVVFP